MRTTGEKIFLCLFACTLIVGIWHALPETTIVGDESLYVGGVLRAMQAHTLVPDIANTYTISFFANYAAMIPVVAGIFAFNHFNYADTISFLYAHYYDLYLVPRLVSLLASLAIAFVLLRLAQLLGRTKRQGMLAVALILSAILVADIMHTGKMWPLTMFFLLLADYCYVLARAHQQLLDKRWHSSPLFWCVGAAALAMTNFPLAAIALLAPALLWWQVGSAERMRLLRYAIGWLVVFVALTLLNVHGWLVQNAASGGGAFAPLQVAWYQLTLLLFLAPLLLLGILAHVDEIKNRALFWLALAQAGVFIVFLSFRVPWILGSVEELRYNLPVVLLLGVALLATSLKREMFLIVLCVLSLIFFCKTLYLLAVPTTYNDARDWVAQNLSQQPVVVVNDMVNLDLPMNAASYALLRPSLCDSRCLQELAHPAATSRYTVIEADGNFDDPAKEAALLPQARYFISSTTSQDGALVASFGANPSADDYYAVDHEVGFYSLRFLSLPQLGQNIYLYKR